LPGILLWALQGWHHLRKRGRFVQPAGVEDAIGDLEDLFSPVGAFVRDFCVVGKGSSVEAGELFAAWREYCQSIGRTNMGTIQTFARDLRAVVPGLRVSQPRMAGGRMRWYEGVALASAQGGVRSDE
jgi:putative DNA primase/helicase